MKMYATDSYFIQVLFEDFFMTNTIHFDHIPTFVPCVVVVSCSVFSVPFVSLYQKPPWDPACRMVR